LSKSWGLKISWSPSAWRKIFPFEYLFFLAKYVKTRPYIENLLKAIWRTSIIKRELYQSLHQNHEVSDFEELDFRMLFKMVYNASQRQYHVFQWCHTYKGHIRRLKLTTFHFSHVATHWGHIRKWMLIAIGVTNICWKLNLSMKSISVKDQNRRLKILHNLSFGQNTNIPPIIPSLHIWCNPSHGRLVLIVPDTNSRPNIVDLPRNHEQKIKKMDKMKKMNRMMSRCTKNR